MIQYLYNNTVEGLGGGISSIIPVILVSGINVIIPTFLYRAHPNNSVVVAFALFSIILGIAGGTVGGVLANSYTDSSYNGILYGAIVSNLVGWYCIISIKFDRLIG